MGFIEVKPERFRELLEKFLKCLGNFWRFLLLPDLQEENCSNYCLYCLTLFNETTYITKLLTTRSYNSDKIALNDPESTPNARSYEHT